MTASHDSLAVTSQGPLLGIRVLDASTGLAGRYAGQLFADLGADVVRVAGADDDDVLLRNRTLLTSQPGQDADATLNTVLSSVDVLLLDARIDSGPLSLAQSVKQCPGLVRVTITPFGLDSPWSERAGDDLIVQALAGAMEITGEPGRPPVRMGAPVLPLMAGAQAVVATLATLQEPRGAGARNIDVSLLDVSLSMLSYLAPLYLTLGTVPARVGSGHPTIYPYNAFQVADGYLVVAPFTGRFWRKFCEVLEVPEWGQDPRFRSFQDRLDNRHILEPMLNERMRHKTRAQWLELLEAGDVPCGPVNTVGEALSMEQTRARDNLVNITAADGSTRPSLAMPIKFTNADGTHYRAPAATARAAAAPFDPPVGRSGAGRPGEPLHGVTVIDLTRMAAGPFCTQMLADLGADVIKVEEPGIGDPTRRNVPMIGGLSSYFLSFNRGKRSVVLDMKTPEGRDSVLALLAEADVVVENFRPGVTTRLALDYDTVRAVNPRIVYASISGFGQTGPLRLKTSFDLVNQAVAGMLSITGEPGRDPVRLGLPVGDLAGGQYTALGVVAALAQRRRTGRGCYVDVSLHDILITLLGPLAQDHLDTGAIPQRLGSQHPKHVPSGVFAAADGDLALEAWTDSAFAELAARLGSPTLAAPELRTIAGRQARREDVNAVLTQILATRKVGDWVALFADSPVGVAPVLNVGAALESDHVVARGLVRELPLPSGAAARTIGSAFRIDGQPIVARIGPPDLGEHSDQILSRLGRNLEAGSTAAPAADVPPTDAPAADLPTSDPDAALPGRQR